MKRIFIFIAALCLGACAGRQEALVVKQFQLRDQVRDLKEEPMVRMEKERRLHGAVSMAERRERLGQYYTLVWQDASGVGQGSVEVVFEYQQGATGSQVKRMTREFSSSEARGIAEFSVVGDNYFDGGRVLVWQASVLRDGKELASRRSFLWK